MEIDAINSGLIAITKAIYRIDKSRLSYGLLGGLYDYGADWDNDVFMMHPACGCESTACPWCAECHCTDDFDCPSCSPSHRWPEKGALPAREPFELSSEWGRAPNFWHKPSGMRVWWHKSIGRGMEVRSADGAGLNDVFAECLASLKQDGKKS